MRPEEHKNKCISVLDVKEHNHRRKGIHHWTKKESDLKELLMLTTSSKPKKN